MNVAEQNEAIIWLRRAYEYAAKYSDDPDTQNAAVVVIPGFGGEPAACAFGANRLPSGVKRLPERMTRPLKYEYLEHAERDSIYESIRRRLWPTDAIMYCPYIACKDCARCIEGVGIKKIVGHKQCMDRMPARWAESVAVGNTILDDAGIIREYYDGPIGGVEHLFDGQIWKP